MNTKEEEFMASLRALMVRYGVKIEKEYTGFDDEQERTFIFSNDVKNREDEVYIDISEFTDYLNFK